MKIEILSRTKLCAHTQEPFPPRTAVIRCCDYGKEAVVLKQKPSALLQLFFDDVSLWELTNANGSLPPQPELQARMKKYHMFTVAQAQEIATFYHHISGDCELLICQCEHGESRSAAIAAAILQHETQNGIEIFADEKFLPNKTVFRMVLTALENSSLRNS